MAESQIQYVRDFESFFFMSLVFGSKYNELTLYINETRTAYVIYILLENATCH